MNENNNVLNEQIIEEVTNKTPETVVNQPKIKPLFEISKRDNVFAICVLAIGIFMSVFGVFGGFALGYSMSMVALVLAFVLYLIKSNKIGVYSFLCIGVSLGNSVNFITTTNGSVKFFSVIISFMLLVAATSDLAIGKTIGNRAALGVFKNALGTMGNVGVSTKSLCSNSNDGKKKIGKVILGLLCSVPVLLVIVPLLIKSDDAFSGMMSSIFEGTGNVFIIVLKSVFGVFVSLFIISYGFSLKAQRVPESKKAKNRSADNVCIISFLSAISACYILYLFSQLAYFFSAFKGFLPNDDITYSEYARKGFFEMCVIAVINLLLVFLSLLLAKKSNGKACIGIRVLATFIALFTLIIIATAISKMFLYIDEYGMTVLRITTSAFMIFLAVTFLAVILRIYVNNINIVKTAIITSGIIVLLLGTVNVNGVCAKYNYQAYKENKVAIDVEAMYNLGDDGIPYLAKLACSKDETIAKDAQHYLAKAYTEDYFEDMYFAEGFDEEALREHQKYKSFSYFSLPRNRAYNTLYGFFEKNPNFDQKCLGYMKQYYSSFSLW